MMLLEPHGAVRTILSVAELVFDAWRMTGVQLSRGRDIPLRDNAANALPMGYPPTAGSANFEHLLDIQHSDGAGAAKIQFRKRPGNGVFQSAPR